MSLNLLEVHPFFKRLKGMMYLRGRVMNQDLRSTPFHKTHQTKQEESGDKWRDEKIKILLHLMMKKMFKKNIRVLSFLHL